MRRLFEVGSKITIRADLKACFDYEYYVNDEMETLAGKEATITNINCGRYTLDIDKQQWCWGISMFAEFQLILKRHRKWVAGEPDGERAYLQGADLRGADLRDAYLRGANLRDADLRYADLQDANLRYADLRDADLQGADLRGADLRDADLQDADLQDADLRGADLRDAYLRGANLRDADLRYADLQDANLRYADLRDADLQGADLRGADLRDADLRGADLQDANLRYADLRDADLQGADLQDADLRDADLRGADLQDADLRGADLRDADLQDADLRGADLRGADNAILPINCPEKGSFIGFKKAEDIYSHENVIVELEILEDAKRSSATSRKCRCSKAKVLSITSLNGDNEFEKANSNRDYSFIYEVGKIVKVDDFDEDRWNECSTGIHFFITRQEAVDY